MNRSDVMGLASTLFDVLHHEGWDVMIKNTPTPVTQTPFWEIMLTPPLRLWERLPDDFNAKAATYGAAVSAARYWLINNALEDD